MQSKVNLEDLLRIVEICRLVERRGIDPFEVDVRSSLNKLKKYLPRLKLLDELLLDAEAINQISSIIKLQSEWIKRRSSSLFIDPVFVELKIRMLDSKSIVEAFRNSWHPIIGMNQIFNQRLKEAVDYWNNLLPLGERWKEDFSTSSVINSLEIQELIDLKVVSLENFDDKMKDLLKELMDKLKFDGKIDYWDFIFAETFEKTLERAYIVSFILTEGYASLILDPIEERTYIILLKEASSEKRHHSLPIAFNFEHYNKFRR